MRTLAARGAVLALLILVHMAWPSAQVRRLTVLNAAPNGEVTDLVDAGEIRITFSEPMIEFGSNPAPAAVPWFQVTPAVKGAFYWSGTRTLIFSPDPATRLPYATKFVARVSTSATAVSGRTLAEPLEFTFTTPTVRLLSAQWYRKTGRATDPVVVAMRFNQRVRPEDVLAHTILRNAPHDWRAPRSLGDQRQALESRPAALAALDAKVTRARSAAASTEAFRAAIATAWDERRFPRGDTTVVLETTGVPPPDTTLAVNVDATMPSPDGPEKHAAQTTSLPLGETFFVDDLPCRSPCDPSSSWSLQFRRGVNRDELGRLLSIRDVTGGGAGTAVVRTPPTTPETYRPADGYTYVAMRDLGFDVQQPARTWRIEIEDTLQSADGQTLGYPYVGILETAHERAYALFTGGLWEANGRRENAVPFMARNVERASLWVMPVTRSDIMLRLQQLRSGQASAPTSVSQTLNFVPDRFGAHGVDLREILSPTGTGLAWMGVNAGATMPGALVNGNQRPSATLLQVTNLGVAVKDSPQSTLVFVTRLDNAAPVEGASVAIVDTGNRERWRGTTDRDGVAMAPALNLRSTQNPWQLQYVVTAEKDGDRAFVSSDGNSGFQPQSFGFPYQLGEANDVLRASIFTDRGVYRQGEELHAKAILRADSPTGMRTLPANAKLQVVIRDGRGREVDKRTVSINQWSSAEWTWRVPEDGSLGNYSILAGLESDGDTLDGRNYLRLVRGGFLVAAFRRPDFRVDTTLTAETPVLGARLNGRVEAKYLFGGAIARQPVRWFTFRGAVLDVPKAIRERYPERQVAFGYLPTQSVNAPRNEKTEPLDAKGVFAVEVPTEIGADHAQAFTFEGDVEGVSGQHIANRSTLTVHPSSFYVGLERPPMFFDTRKGGAIKVLAVGLDGTARAGVPVTLSILQEQWVEAKPAITSGYTPPWERREVVVSESTVTTTAAGTPFQIPLKAGGCYILRGVARDEQGRPTRTDVRFYAIGPGPSFWRSEGNRIELTPERKTWSPGETARILVQSPWDRATALVTVEREGIRSHRRVEISSRQDTVDVPISERDVPNVFVSVLLVKGRTSADPGADQIDPGQPSFRVGYTELTVDDAAKRLRVDVTADRQEYRPRDQVRVSVGVSSPSSTPGASREVTLWAMDYGLLSLTGYQAPDVARAIYARKSLQVMTADNRVGIIARQVLLTTPGQQAQGGGGGGRGGGGGIPAPSAPPPPEQLAFASRNALAQTAMDLANESIEQEAAQSQMRTDFRPLVFWLGSVTTDASGRATTTVTLPDSLTTYTILAVASDSESRFGAGDAEIRTAKPVTMLPAFPRFLVAGDRASFGAVVTNNTGTGGDATVTIKSLEAGALQFGGVSTRTLRLAPGESANVRFDATARAAGSARVQMTIALGANTDAFEMPLPVFVPASLETVAAYGDTLTSVTERLRIPAGIVPGMGGLTVSLASTALVGLEGPAKYLDEYPYQCAEQKASRALALLLSADLGGAFGLPGAKPEEHRATATKLLTELYGYQCGDGGFSFWAGECRATSAYLTAYVLDVFRSSGRLNVAIDRNVTERALNYLTSHLQEPPPEIQWRPAWSASQAYAAKVLTSFGRQIQAQLTRLYGNVESMPTFALSYLADALYESGDRGPRYADVVRRISNKLALDADRAHVEEIDDVSLSWLWNTNVRATAVVLGGLARRGGDTTFVAPMARWLLAARQNGRWGTTQENAVALDALVSYYRAFEAEIPQMKADVTLAGRSIGTAAFAGRSTTAQQIRIAMPDLVQQVTSVATRDLVVSRTGTGRLYYTARLQYLAPESPEPVDRGIRLERRYERYSPDGPGEAATSFATGDLVRVTVTVRIPHEGRFLAVTDPVAAGFEPIDGTLKTTATDLGLQATVQSSGRDWRAWMRRGGFDHVEKHDDRVVAFATRLAAGTHEFSYLVRATTTGSFSVAGVRAEAMYAPEISGRSAAGRVEVK